MQDCRNWPCTAVILRAGDAAVFGHITTYICIGRMLRWCLGGGLPEYEERVGTASGQWDRAAGRYTIVYKLYGLFIYSISYVCIYMNICIRREGLFFVLFAAAGGGSFVY